MDDYYIKSSYSGRYILMIYHQSWGDSRAACYFSEVGSSENYDISQGLENFGQRSFHFSSEDKELLTFLVEPRGEDTRYGMLTVSVWKLGEGQPVLCCSKC